MRTIYTAAVCLTSLFNIAPHVAGSQGERKRERDSFCPVIRYIPWDELGWKNLPFGATRLRLTTKLGYSARTWNFDPLLRMWNPLEDASWDSDIVQDGRFLLKRLGYEEDSWDCCINHYEDYEWADFEIWEFTEQIAAIEALGWTEDSWESTNESDWPDTESMTWDELTTLQQEMAASKLCYTKEAWDEALSLDQWPEGFDVPDTW